MLCKADRPALLQEHTMLAYKVLNGQDINAEKPVYQDIKNFLLLIIVHFELG